MKNYNSIIGVLLASLAYIANSVLLPSWSHTLVGIFTGLIILVAYWLIGNKLKTWVRISISIAIAIATAVIIRIVWF